MHGPVNVKFLICTSKSSENFFICYLITVMLFNRNKQIFSS